MEPPSGSRGGVFYGWWIVVAAFFAALGSVSFFNPTLGVFSQLLEEEFGWSRADVAGAISISGLAAGLAAPAAGVVLDRWGGRWVTVGSGLVIAACALALSQVSELWHLLLFFGIGRAVAVSAMSPAAYVASSNWFVRRRPLVTGIVAVGGRAGVALFPVAVALVIDLTGSWRAGWVAVGLITAATVLPALVFMRRRPEDMGLWPDGDAAPAGDSAASQRGEALLALDFTLREAMRTRAYWLIAVAVGLIVFCTGAVNFHQIPHLIDQGLPRTQAALVVTVMAVMGAAGAFFGGVVAQRLTIRWTMAISLAGMSLSVLLLVGADSLPTAIAYAMTYGGFFGVVISQIQVVFADYFGRRSMAVIRSSTQPYQMGMNAAGTFLVGVWYDRVGSYDVAFTAFAGAFALCALALVLSVYPPSPSRTPSARDEVRV